ncbi:MAG: YgiT-type zinc finger protein [Candidatus Omnitrophica bacterium]|nr:YgiT-type zinc finger protein [Candidatus Omnitrophota bacterium]
MECPVCHNKMEDRLIRHIQEWKGHYVIFENVPALVCSICKETLLTPNNVDRINETLWLLPKSSRKEEVDVYELSKS